MKAYFAVGAGSTAIKMLPGQNVLVSFAYVGSSWLTHNQFAKLRAVASGLMVDSGAFTAWRQGRTIDLAAYADWLASLRTTAGIAHDHAITLDVIGDAEASMRQWTMLPGTVPVWHEGDPEEHLDEYVRVRGEQLIGLGRTEGRRSVAKTMAFYDAAFNRWPDAKFHALGNSTPEMLEPYPFESFDSTSWERDAAYHNAAPYPYKRASKELRMRAHIEAAQTIAHRPAKQLRLALAGKKAS